MTAAPKQTLGRYELLELLGRGSATESFRAKSFGVEGFEKTLVVKRVLSDVAVLPEFLHGFLEHVQRALRLSHANLAQTFDLASAPRTTDSPPEYYFATEYVAGVDLETLLQRSLALDTRPSVALATYVALEVAKALEHAHRRRDEQGRPLEIVHGSVSPHNVMIGFEGDVKLTDFGVTRALLALPRPWSTLGRTYASLAPEQASGGAATVSSDVYSLGTLLYALLAGHPPVQTNLAGEALRNAETAYFKPILEHRPQVPPPLAEIIGRALERDPSARYPSVSAFHEELLACTYACGLRASSGDVSRFVDHYRGADTPVPDDAIGVALSRPLSMPPLALDEPHEDVPLRSPATIPPLTGFGEMHHVSVLMLTLANPAALSDALRTRMVSAFERYGASSVRETGAEVVAFFGLDRADGRDTERAVRCGLVLARGLDVGELRPSVGIDSGRLRVDAGREPMVDERTERLVDATRTLSSEAIATVRVSRRAGALLRGRFPLETSASGLTIREFSQDGFSDPFVGRKSELSHLGEMLVLAARGELQVIGIVGDPGVGKTRLAVEVQRRLARGTVDLRTFFATCPPRGRKLPQSGIVAMLRRVCGVRDGDPPERIEALEPRLRALGLDTDEVLSVMGELGAPAPSARVAPWAALRNAVLRMMQSLAEDRFTVFVWDDAHELDDASADLLTRAAARLAHSRIAIVLSGRPDSRAPYMTLPIRSELRLGAMPSSDIERLVELRIGVDEVPRPLLEFLQERADGQPMFVEELLRQLESTGMLVVEDGHITSLLLDDRVPVPRTLRALTGERLRTLSDDERHLFVAAAVLEPPVDAGVLARMLSLELPVVDAVAESLVTRGLLRREGPSSFGFPSPLAREVVLSELDAQDLATLHRRAADAHEVLGDESERDDADRVGYHLAAAGDRDAAADHYARTGLVHLASRKLVRAALSLAYALDLTGLESRPSAQVENWVRALGAAVRYVRTGPTLPSLIDRLVRRVESESAAPLGAGMRIDVASILGALDRALEGEALLNRGLDANGEEPAVRALFLAAEAQLASGRGEFRLAARALDAIGHVTFEDRAEAHRVTLSRARVLGAAGDVVGAQVALRRAGELAAPDDALLALDRAVVQTTLYAQAGLLREAADAAVQAASQAEELGLVYEVASSLSDQAVAFIRLGDAARARAAVASGLHAAEEANAERIVVRSRLVLGFLEDDAGELALDAQRDRIVLCESQGWIADALLGRYLLGRSAARSGNAEEAREELEFAGRIATSTENIAFAELLSAEVARIG
jgi:serine/threonine protein kinase